MPPAAKYLLIFFYKLYYSTEQEPECSRNPFVFSSPPALLAQEFSGKDYADDFKRLKNLLNNMGVSIPPCTSNTLPCAIPAESAS